jgi:hypothetical protein
VLLKHRPGFQRKKKKPAAIVIDEKTLALDAGARVPNRPFKIDARA